MSSPASVESRDRVRLFAGFPLPEDTCAAVVGWQARELDGGPGCRVVPRSNLHVTLAFLGPRPRDELDAIRSTLLAAAAAAEPPVLTVSRYRETRSVGMIVFDDERGRATAFAGDLQERLEKLGVYERERRPWLPHLTVLRFRTPPRLRPPLPELGEVSPSEAALYHSVLRPTGAQYEVLDSVALGG
jgi:RNA 2',3'-cyclic 3'-phosphodiesterase